jgi:hypothetical protein
MFTKRDAGGGGLMPIRIRLSILMQNQIQIRILSQVLHLLENQNFFTFKHSTTSRFHCLFFFVSVTRVKIVIFRILQRYIEIFVEKYCSALHLVEMDTDPDPPK